MPRRIEIELTSSREDGSWTWRAAGAKEPRGTIPGSILPEGAKVGDVLRVDAEFFVDGISITGVVTSKSTRQEPERLELFVATKDEPLVTTTLATRSRDDRGPRRDGPRRDGGERGRGTRADKPAGDGRPPRGERPARADRPERKDRAPRRTRPEPPPVPVVERPKAKRLRPGKTHRNALLESLPEEQRPVAEQVVLGGLPAVRQAIEKQNAERTAAGDGSIAAGPLLELAEKLVPKVRTAEWRDRAEAAQRDLDVLDLRDLRSVVSTADAAAKDDESRALAKELREGLAARAEAEHASWLEELTATVEVGRIVRALRLSSRPPKAGAPLPADLATKLTEGAGAALTDDAPAERWVAVLDALAFAPVRDKVIPTSLPKDLHADVRATIARLATRIPKIAHIFEIAPDRNAPRPKVERRRPKKQPPKPKPAKGERKDKGPKPGEPKPTDTAEQSPDEPDMTAETPSRPDLAVAAAEATVPEPTMPDAIKPTDLVEHTPSAVDAVPGAADPEVAPVEAEAPAPDSESTVPEAEAVGAPSTPEPIAPREPEAVVQADEPTEATDGQEEPVSRPVIQAAPLSPPPKPAEPAPSETESSD